MMIDEILLHRLLLRFVRPRLWTGAGKNYGWCTLHMCIWSGMYLWKVLL